MSPSRFSRGAFVVSLSAAAVGLGRAGGACAPAPFADLSELARRRGLVTRVRVYSLPANITTMIAVSPSALASFPGVRARTHADRATIDAIVDAFARAKPTPDREPFDARFGVVFLDRDGTRRFAAYADAGASRGMLGRHSVAFDDALPLLTALRRAAR